MGNLHNPNHLWVGTEATEDPEGPGVLVTTVTTATEAEATEETGSRETPKGAPLRPQSAGNQITAQPPTSPK